MTRKIVAAVLILLAGGAWIYLDYLDKQEKREAEAMRKEMEMAHARVVAKGRFESEIYNDLAICRQAAKDANHEYVTRNEQPVPGKPGQFTTSRAVMDEAVRKLEAAYVECQHTYDARLKAGSQPPGPANSQPVK